MEQPEPRTDVPAPRADVQGPRSDAGTPKPDPRPTRLDTATASDPPDMKSLLARGDRLLAIGDIAAARLLYERAASLGSGKAATMVGRTYDPAYLSRMKVNGPRPDPAMAASWYRSGLTLGDPDAAAPLSHLSATTR